LASLKPLTVADFVASWQEYPPGQKSGSFSVDQVLEQLDRDVGPDGY
jgi:hypothetical protein